MVCVPSKDVGTKLRSRQELARRGATRTSPRFCSRAVLPLGTRHHAGRIPTHRCTTCGCEAHYKFQYVLDKNAINEPVCRACYWRQWAAEQRRLAYMAPVPVDLEKVRQHAEENGLDYLGPLTDPSLPEDPHRTRCNRCGKISAERTGDIAWGCTCRANPKRQQEPRNQVLPRLRTFSVSPTAKRSPGGTTTPTPNRCGRQRSCFR